MAGTDHDFTGEGVGLCSFCHSPHRAQSTSLLWNHRFSVNIFQWDIPETTAGTQFPSFAGDTYRGVTSKCLSCHDGSVAIGDIVWWQGKVPSFPLDDDRHGLGDDVNIGFGGNLAGNHPVAMPFPFQQTASTYNGVTTGSSFVPADWQPDPRTLGIRLFVDDGLGNISAGAIVGRTGIECSSCHDPHNRETVDEFFLRGRQTGSTTAYLCLKCHIK
jgi:hypothetical protein